ncbi:hypothetical protein SR882_10380 [Guyparkeria halophila]|uniref:Uncharacterized protein n=1 Tax=Guyparkeria halophila TaxID=47960 RepID=A0ABZ0YVF3_9GAMM|nr:hypothetical protein [Guyparkeria halophila]WQH16156.1 hypothetical protein SR882_10380 [Guyparkeria halophila]
MIRWVLVVAALVVTAGSGFGGYQLGHRAGVAEMERQQLDSMKRAVDTAADATAENAELFRKRAAERSAARRTNQRTAEEVSRHVATHPDLYGQRLDPCGLCLVRAAAAGRDPDDCPCRGDGPLSADRGTGADGG